MPNQPIPKWEEEFDAIYGENLDTQLLGIIASTLTHAQTKPIGTSASFLTEKLRKIVATAHTEWREQGKREIEALKPDFTKMVHDLKGQCDHERLVTIQKVASLPFLQP